MMSSQFTKTFNLQNIAYGNLSDVRVTERLASISRGEWVLSAEDIANGVVATESPRIVAPGTVVGISAFLDDYDEFIRWNTTPEVKLTDPENPVTSFVMPDSNVQIQAYVHRQYGLGDTVIIGDRLQLQIGGQWVTPPAHTVGLEDVVGDVRNNGTEIFLTSLNTWARIIPYEPAVTNTVTVVRGFGSGTFPIGSTVEILATPHHGFNFTHWTMPSGNVPLANPNSAHTSFRLGHEPVVVEANFSPVSTTPPGPAPGPGPGGTPPGGGGMVLPGGFNVGGRVRVNNGVTTWATGEGMPSWVHGRTYPIIQIRTRNGIQELLLGEGIMSWARASDVSHADGAVGGGTVHLGSRVRLNNGVRTWATGEGIPSWVHGRTYPVIEMRTRNGVQEVLLGEGINSWARRTDVVLV